MKTVDALTATRDFLVRHPERWTQGSLYNNGCFCVVGALSFLTGCMDGHGKRAKNVGVSSLYGPYSALINGHFVKVDELPKRVLNGLDSAGIHLAAGRMAIRYLNAVVEKLYPKQFCGKYAIMGVNDIIGYEAVIGCLNQAIKNAKRRHINGDRQKVVAQ